MSLEEAESVFFDENALLIPDPDHSNAEDRFLLLGMSAQIRLLVVCHCFRETGSVIRIISARRAGARERQQYGDSSQKKTL